MKWPWNKDDDIGESDPFASDPAFSSDPSAPPGAGMGQPMTDHTNPFGAPPQEKNAFPPMGQPLPMDSIRTQEVPDPGQMMPPQAQGTDVQKDIALLIAKMDAVKSELDSINIRLMRMEKNMETEQQKAQQSQKKYANIY